MNQTMALSRPLDGLSRQAARARKRAAALWAAYPRETLGVGMFALVTASAIASTFVTPSAPKGAGVAPPSPPPMIVRPIAPEQALKVNAEIPLMAGPNPSAASFVFKGDSATRAQALNCLASAVYYEAGNQDENGARAVAQVVLNRVRHPAFPSSVCGVVYQGSTRPTGCQFTFTCDGSLNRQPDADGWRRATRIAEQALAGSVYVPVGWATHYHADYVVPYWAATMPIITIGLQLPGRGHAPRDLRASFGRWRKGEVGRGDARYVHVKIDAVQQRPGDPRLIIGGAARGAAAGERGIAEMPATARVHCRHQLHPRRKRHMGVGAGHADIAGFKRLPQRIEDRSLEFRKLVEEKHAEVGQADLAGTHFQSATDQGRHRSAVVRRTKWAPTPNPSSTQFAGDRSDHRHFQRFAGLKRRENARKACSIPTYFPRTRACV